MVEHETQKLKELDEEHSQELKEWREKLRPRKKVLLKALNKIHLHSSMPPSSWLLTLYLICVRDRRHRDEESRPQSFRI